MDFFSCITLNEAEQLVKTKIGCVTGLEKVGIAESLNRTAGMDIPAGEDMPPFSRSTVDGYAVQSGDTFGAEEGIPALLEIVGEIQMGKPALIPVEPGQTVAIPTGGMLPEGADAVVMVEHTEQFDAGTVLMNRKVGPGENVIQRGEDIHSGQFIIREGQVIRPQDIGLLAACGYRSVVVRKPLCVGVLSTGDEIVDIRTVPALGQIRDVNRYLLQAMLMELGCQVRSYGIVGDDYDQLAAMMSQALNQCQLVVISGGSSVGSRDYTVQVINSLGSPGVLFHGVAVKPGKPTIFGVVNSVPVFGLPGHPAAAMIMFTRLVKPVVEILSGRQANRIKHIFPARMARNVASAPGRDDFISVRIQKNEGEYWAEPVFGRSGLISTMTEADGIVHIPAEVSGLYAGDRVDVELFGQDCWKNGE
ncbi:MAG: gephyrin-like molybdotransferase Glp [Thermoactinomyces sp.]